MIEKASKVLNLTPNYAVQFFRDDLLKGTIDFNGSKISFEGDADDSAAIFVQTLSEKWEQRMKAERERAAQLVDHILCEGGGTYGDKIRELT